MECAGHSVPVSNCFNGRGHVEEAWSGRKRLLRAPCIRLSLVPRPFSMQVRFWAGYSEIEAGAIGALGGDL